MDVLKCLTEGKEFMCHEPAREGQHCSGWAMMMLAEDKTKFRDAPWPFSDDAEGLALLRALEEER